MSSALLKSTSLVALVNLCSRFLGLARSILIASFLGTTLVADAFTLAFKIPNLLRRFVAEGSLTVSFIPVFSEFQKKCNFDKNTQNIFISKFLTLLAICLLTIYFVCLAFTPFLLNLLFSFSKVSADLTIILTQLMFIYIVFISIGAIFQAILNASGYFATPALSPIFLNVTLIFFISMLSPFVSLEQITRLFPSLLQYTKIPELHTPLKAVFALSLGVIFGGFIQMIMHLPLFLKLGFRISPKFKFNDPYLKKIGTLMIPGLFAMGIYQINAIVADPFALSYVGGGGVAALNYSNRLLEFQLGVFVISLATVLLPTLSKIAANNDSKKFSEVFLNSLKATLFISIPSCFGLIIFRQPIVSLLFQSGAFQEKSVLLVCNALFYHGLGLVFIGLYRLYAQAFYALQDTKTPVKAAFISLLVHFVLCAGLSPFFGIKGIAGAASISSLGQCLFLHTHLKSKLGGNFKFPWYNTFKTILISLIMSLSLYVFMSFVTWDCLNKIAMLVWVLAGLTIACSIYFLFSWLFKVEELNYLFQVIRNKLKK